jgi:hypothetical protein
MHAPVLLLQGQSIDTVSKHGWSLSTNYQGNVLQFIGYAEVQLLCNGIYRWSLEVKYEASRCTAMSSSDLDPRDEVKHV